MQMVAAAKLRKAQEAAEAARPYAERMSSVMANISAGVQGSDNAPKLMAGSGKDDVHLIVVMTAERGLCGGFNSSIARIAREKAASLMADGKTVKMICVGKKGYDALKSQFTDQIIKLVELKDVKQVGFENAADIGKTVIDMFDGEEFDVCTICYSEFQSVISQIPTAQQIIPADVPEASDGEGDAVQYEYEPEEGEILEDLLPRNIAMQIFRGLLENGASEQGARMSAMDNATRNAGEMIDKLTISYNRQRQAQITKELIEIISGAEAL